MTNIVLFNGPPRSGKDTAVSLVHSAYKRDAVPMKFATPLKAITRSFAEFMGDQHGNVLSNELGVKEQPNKFLLNTSPRNFQISISEDWMKPVFGLDVFGHIAAQQIKLFPEWQTRMFLFSDSGFRDEAAHLVNVFGADNVLLVRLHRMGCDFTLDSRSYIELADIGVTEVDVTNDATKEHLRETLLSTIKNWKEAI
jgi:SNF2 family DNA or RNA helicase